MRQENVEVTPWTGSWHPLAERFPTLSTGQRAMAVAIGLAEAGLRNNGRFRRGSVPLRLSR